MGKGKRNRQFHFEDKQANPKKYQEKKKKQFHMPRWATYTIALVVALAIIVPIVITSLIGNGTFLRSRVLVESESGKFDLNQQMATFILWQNMYQSAYYEYYYMSWGLQQDPNNVTKTYKSAAEYGIAMASMYTEYYLREGLNEISDYLVELVAGADAGLKIGLKLEKSDDASIEEFSAWMENVWAAYMSSSTATPMTYNNFLKEAVGDGVKPSDIKAAAKLITMYTKYCNYTKLELDDDPTEDILQEFIEKNPSGHYEIKYFRYTNAGETFMKKLYEACGKTWDPDQKDEKEVNEETKDLLLSLEVKKFRELVIESILEDEFKTLVMNQYVVNGSAKDALKSLKEVINKKDVSDEEITAKLTELGITPAAYKSDNKEINEDVSEWIFNSKRKDKETTIIQSGDSVYLVYIATKPTTDTENKKLSNVVAGWKEYKYEDVEDEEIASYKDLLYKDLDAGEKSELTSHKYLSADDMVLELFNTIVGITANAKLWDNQVAETEGFKKDEVIKAPAEGETPTLFQSVLYAADADVKANKIYQIDDEENNTSYLLKVTKIEGTDYTVAYATYTDGAVKTAKELAKEMYDKIHGTEGTPSYWDTLAKEDTFVKEDKISKPADNDDSSAIQDVLYASGTKVKVGDYFKVNDNGTSYLVKVTDVKGTNYTIAYAVREDSDYHALYRSLYATFSSAYKKEPSTLTHPETTEKGSANEWLCEGEYKDGDRVFDRKPNDVAHFEVKDSNGKATGKYNVYIVDTAMTQVKKEDATVYGGYLLFATEKEAEAAKNSLQNKYNFALWSAFGALSTQKTTTNSSGEQSTSTVNATLETDIIKSDITDKELQSWLFSDARKADDLAVIKATSGYYLAYYRSGEQSWLRTAKDSWVASQMTEILDKAIKDGGYEINTKNLNKIPASEMTTTGTTTAAKS